MYIETWQLIFIPCIAACAYFSYRSGWKAGVSVGVHMVIKDLAYNTIISVVENVEDEEVTVGRYDADPQEMKNDAFHITLGEQSGDEE